MADNKPAFGVFPQMKPRRSQQDREAAKNVPVDLARGFVSGTLGMPGDIESLARLPYELITGKESATILPTSGDIEKRLPFKSDTPVSRAATGLGQLGGGAYTGPLSGARAATAIPKAVTQAGKDFVMAAGQPAVNVVKPSNASRGVMRGPQEGALTLARQRAEKLGQSANPEERMLQQGYEQGWYHGGTGDITRFRSDLLGETTGAQSAKKGFFFARDPQNPPEAMLKKSNDPASIEMLKKLGIPEEEIAKLNTVSMKGHGAETASGYALIGGSREYKEAMRKAKAAEKRGDWSEYEKQTQIAEDDAIGKAQYLQGLVAKYGDARDEMLDAIQKSIYNKKLPQEQAELLDQKVKQLMPYGWYNSYSNPQLDGLKKEIVNLVGENAAQTSLEKINKFQSVKNERALMERTEEGGNVMPVALRYEKPMVYDFEGKPYRDQSYSDLVDQAIAGGHDALILKNTFDPGSGPAKLVDVGVVFNPDQVRSKFAAFDPLRKTSAIAASAGLAAPDLLAEERKAKGGEVTMDKGGAAFGVFPQMKGKRSKQDREAAKTFPIDVARGFVSGALGMPGDIESLVRMLPGLDEKTILPTSEDIEKRLPLRSDSPVSRAATGLGQIGGGFYTGPLSGARAVTAIPKAVGKAGKDFVMAAGQPAVNVVKPKGGNFLTDRLGMELTYLKGNRRAAQDLEAYQQGYTPDFLATIAPEIRALENQVAINNWIDRNLTNYIKNQMATPEDPVRLMLDKRTAEVEAKFAKDMERADRLAERAAAETDPRMKVNLTRNAEQAKMAAEMERDLAMSHMLPSQESLMGTARQAAGESRVNRAVEGFPEEGMAKSPAGKVWEDITDSDMGVSANRAGDAQSAVEKKQKTDEALAAFYAKGPEIDEAFIKQLVGRGLTPAEIQSLDRGLPTHQKLRLLDNINLKDEYERLESAASDLRGTYKDKDLNIAERYPWVEKLDPETRLYEFYGSHDLGFDHIIDVLKQDVAAGRITSEQLNRMSVDQAVRRAAEYDKELAEKMNSARAAAREGLPVYKEYPEGYRWVELNKPGSFSSESEAMGHSVRGYEPPKGHPDWVEGAGDSGSLGYGHGGWEGIKSGKAKVYSLVDPKGAPHVTVEIGSGKLDPGMWYEAQPQSVRDAIDAAGFRGYNIRHSPQFKAADAEAPPTITQIKGKQNTRPSEKYDQYTQDFVKSGNWSDVRDLGNTGLYRVTPGQRLPGFSKEIDPGYYSIEDFKKMAAENEMPQDILDNWVTKLQEQSRYGYKRGGRVSISDNADGQMMDVLDKKMAGGGLAAKIAKLARAPAKSAAEIEAIAQRIAPQVTGEFVRGDKGTASVAGKTQKQFAREKELPVDFTDIKNAPPIQTLNPEKLQGSVVTGIPGDPTVTGRSLTRVGDIKLDSPSPQHGGPLYGLYQPDDVFWASGIGPAGGVQRVAKEAMEAYDAPVLGQYIMMGPDSINYAQHFADANLSAIDLSKMSKKQIEQFNKLIRFGDNKSGPRPTFPGIENKEDAYLHLAFDPHLRRHFNKLMQMPTVTEPLNLPSGQDIRFATTEPVLRDLETGVTGFSMGKLNPEVSKSGLKLSSHPTYSHDIPGEFMGGMKYPVPYELSFPDTLKSVRENPKQAGQEFGSLKMVGPRQIYDQQMIDELKQYEEAMKRLTGKKEGGEVEMAGGGAVKAGIKEMMERIANRFGGFEAARLERAADEVPNLEKLYQPEALESLFRGDNAKGIMTMPPQDFEKYATKLPFDPDSKKGFLFMPPHAENLPENMTQKEYIRYLADLHGFSDVPFLEVNTTPFGKKPAPFISGHEGRHRSRALTEAGQPASLVQFLPRANLRESMPRRSREEYLKALNDELEMTNRMVRPQKSEPNEKPRSLVRLPTVYKEGGAVDNGLIKVKNKRKARG